MSKIKDFTGLNWFALWFLGIKGINRSPDPDRGVLNVVLQYWSSQINISSIFTTIFISTGTLFFVQFESCYKFIALPFIFLAVFFGIRTWAFSRCASIAMHLWL